MTFKNNISNNNNNSNTTSNNINNNNNNNNNNLRGGLPALTCVVSPYGGPVNAGEPGIHSAHPRVGFSQSPLHALCRRASSCAWRSRLRRRCPCRRSGCDCGRREVRSGRHPWATLAAQTVPSRIQTGIFGLPWRTGRPRVAPSGQTGPEKEVRQTLRTV